MSASAVVVVNPAAGTAARRRALRGALSAWVGLHGGGAARRPITVREAGSREEGVRAAQQAAHAGASRVIAAGGDGTLQAVVTGLVAGAPDPSKRPWLGIVPSGRGNDLARALGLPRAPHAALELALAGDRTLPLDLGRLVVDGRETLFANAVGMGFDGDVAVRARRLPLHGLPAYALAALGTMAVRPGPWQMKGSIDGRPVEAPVTIFTVANGNTTGGGFVMVAAARPDDGLLDFGQIGPSHRSEILRFLWRALRADLAREPRFETGRFAGLTVQFVPGVPVHADGEIVSSRAREVTIEVLPAALRAIVPLGSKLPALPESR